MFWHLIVLFISIYFVISICWGFHSIEKQKEYPESSMIRISIAFLVNVLFFPFCLIYVHITRKL